MTRDPARASLLTRRTTRREEERGRDRARRRGSARWAWRSGSPWTPGLARGSQILALVGLAACADGRADDRPARPAPGPAAPSASTPAPSATPPASAGGGGETCLGVADRGIWSDLDDQIALALPTGLTPARVRVTRDPTRPLLVLWVDDWPTKPYPLGGPATLTVGDQTLALRPGDRAELAPLLTADRLTVAAATPDRDRDGLPDVLDALIGARKTVQNADAYRGGYESIPFPMGDVPRDHGVCTDVIVRALRNAGIDLQAALQADLRRARSAYPMVKGRGDPNIDHRRVKTLLPYLRRHLETRSPAVDDPADPIRPGDLILFDTFPSRSGPDHIGIASERAGDSGLPLIINNWTDGTVTTEMDLLAWVPVTHRFRLR